MIGAAILDESHLYRYQLTRVWDEAREPVSWIMLNPSTADRDNDDATIRRVIGFSERWGHGSALVVNLFAHRSRDPTGLLRCSDPVGPRNDEVVAETVAGSSRVIIAWGNRGSIPNPLTGTPRHREMWRLLEALGTKAARLGRTASGQPRHPLYLPADTTPEVVQGWR